MKKKLELPDSQFQVFRIFANTIKPAKKLLLFGGPNFGSKSTKRESVFARYERRSLVVLVLLTGGLKTVSRIFFGILGQKHEYAAIIIRFVKTIRFVF